MKKFSFKIHGNPYKVHIHNVEEGFAEIEVNGTRYHVELEEPSVSTKTPKLVRARTPEHSGKHRPVTTARISSIKAPLPGTIIEIFIKGGDKLEPEQVVMVMEAMKMENRVLAEMSGTVKAIRVSPGESVLQDQVLVELE